MATSHIDRTPFLHNSRFYILAFSVLLSISIISLTRLTISSDPLFFIRAEQLYGLVGILFWYIALVISPLSYVIGKQRTRHLEYARRAIGVSAAYFALLHTFLALFAQLGGILAVTYLPLTFQISITLGGIALIILTLMAVTSFDRVITFMTFPRWKLLHRFVYFGGILAVLHIWMVGTHLAYQEVQLIAFGALVLISCLETFRTLTILSRRSQILQDKGTFLAILITSCTIIFIGLLLLPSVVKNYHSSHHETSSHTDELRIAA